TRNASNTLGFTATRPDTKDVTTFLIEREGEPGAGGGGKASDPLVAGIQAELARLGHYAGDADGRLGPDTVAAIRAFEAEHGFAVRGTADEALLAALKGGADTGRAAVAVLPK